MRPSYRQYEQKKLGYRKNAVSGILFMVKQSFMASSFRKFWQNWNPLFSYYLLYFCYRPLKKILPNSLAVVFTFALSGLVHDLAATLVLSRIYFFFTLLFAVFGLFILAEKLLGFSLPANSRIFRPFYHVFLILLAYFLARWILAGCLLCLGAT